MGRSDPLRGQRNLRRETQIHAGAGALTYAKEWDERKYQVIQSNVADPETEQWTRAVERRLTKDFRTNAVQFGIPDLPHDSDTIGWWELMQHHGVPTRLLDWTRSPFIALCGFALNEHTDDQGDMAIWTYDRRNALLNHAKAQRQLDESEEYDRLGERELVNRYVRLALADGNPALIPVQTRQFARSVAQRSTLTVSPNISTGRFAHTYIRKKLACRLRLREEWKPDMIAACTSMGLSRDPVPRPGYPRRPPPQDLPTEPMERSGCLTTRRQEQTMAHA